MTTPTYGYSFTYKDGNGAFFSAYGIQYLGVGTPVIPVHAVDIGGAPGFTSGNPGNVAVTSLPALAAGAATIGGVNIEIGGVAAGTAGNPVVTADANGAAFQGVVALASGGAAVAAARSIGFICTASGTLTLTLADGSSIAVPIVAATNFQTLPFAVTAMVLSGGAAGSFWNLK